MPGQRRLGLVPGLRRQRVDDVLLTTPRWRVGDPGLLPATSGTPDSREPI
ncbi:cell envelope biogenesis protein OmpA [Actinomyces naeslundii]|uniref:Cell envelope biogenesis protein OmpA n=1 Tax=Actinomyces naeslundii TaxID=1655 RepID=A0A1R1H3K6_ACTNA|nr:cell envelope biogenesis protein OmpA [Actinomyces naeslundii]OMG08313.1 cell envelope biogenesis protein OmpA [Actinomyces naeslundii]OMG18716.1 cell envelope biogenesis protein OmpA [Actinomyces naeslundii]OMG21231.1 cell envelope biogenesis protein OmpA [Actinomyces naeslundii]OMG22277.1 cell envelope biogenesis protein OmpA [Actinomyces naeslundii]